MTTTRYQARSKKELSHAYNISVNTLNSWLRPFQEKIGEYRGKTYTPKQIKTIFDLIGEPETH